MKTISLSVVALFISALSWAQEKTAEVDINVNKDGGGGNWYASPFVWIIGAAVFILLLVALTRGRSAD